MKKNMPFSHLKLTLAATLSFILIGTPAYASSIEDMESSAVVTADAAPVYDAPEGNVIAAENPAVQESFTMDAPVSEALAADTAPSAAEETTGGAGSALLPVEDLTEDSAGNADSALVPAEDSSGNPDDTEIPTEGSCERAAPDTGVVVDPAAEPDGTAADPVSTVRPDESAGDTVPVVQPDESAGDTVPVVQPDESAAGTIPTTEPGEDPAVVVTTVETTDAPSAAPSETSTEDPAPVIPAVDPSPVLADNFQMTIPTVYIHINGGQEEIEKLNGSEDHSHHSTGTMDIIIPEGFQYVDSTAVLTNLIGAGIDIRGRGNSTWGDEKKPYKIKLDKKAAILGMGQNKHWALLANSFDPTLSRNRITFWLGKQLGLDFTPSGYPVDVFMEDEYLGSYLLCETIRVDKNRVDIPELEEDDVDESDITGGYLIQIQQDPGAASTFKTRKEAMFQNVTPSFDPEEGDYENDTQKDYIRGYMQEAEDALFEGETADETEPSGYRTLDYKDYFDLNSAALYWLIQEFSMNGDAYVTGSSYLYKTRDTDEAPGKLFWGPLWDFDFAWDYGGSPIPDSGDFSTDMLWMYALMTDTGSDGLPALIQSMWPSVRAKLQEVAQENGLLDQYYKEVSTSQSYNQAKYQTKDTEDRPIVFREAIDRLKDWIIRRIGWTDEHIASLNNYSHKVYYKTDPDDEHPEVFCMRTNQEVHSAPEDPEKEGYYFTGWYTEDGTAKEDLKVTRDLTLTAAYLEESLAKKVESIFFKYGNDIAVLEYGEYSPLITIFPSDALRKSITWESSDDSIASVQKNGMIAPHKTGTVTITAKLKNGTEKSFHLTVVEKETPAGDVFLPTETVYMKVGEVSQMQVQNALPGALFEDFSHENDGILEVDDNGVLIAKKPGQTTVRADVTYTGEDGETKEKALYLTVIVSEDKPEETPEEPEDDPVQPQPTEPETEPEKEPAADSSGKNETKTDGTAPRQLPADPIVKDSASHVSAAQTGDDTMTGLWAVLLIVSLFSILMVRKNTAHS